jgi:hypothetical protein
MKRSRIGRIVMSGVLAVSFWGGPAHAATNNVFSIVQSDEFPAANTATDAWYALGVLDGINLVLDYWMQVGLLCRVNLDALVAKARQHAAADHGAVSVSHNGAAVYDVLNAALELGCTVEPAT